MLTQEGKRKKKSQDKHTSWLHSLSALGCQQHCGGVIVVHSSAVMVVTSIVSLKERLYFVSLANRLTNKKERTMSVVKRR